MLGPHPLQRRLRRMMLPSCAIKLVLPGLLFELGGHMNPPAVYLVVADEALVPRLPQQGNICHKAWKI